MLRSPIRYLGQAAYLLNQLHHIHPGRHTLFLNLLLAGHVPPQTSLGSEKTF
jgi:hypothetical protein